MNHRLFLAPLGATLLFTVGCAQSAPATGAISPAAAVAISGRARWTTSLRSMGESHIDAPVDSARNRSFGSAVWTPGANPALSRVDLNFAYGGADRDLSWAILYGRCGSASLPVISKSNFPELDVRGGGIAKVSVSLALEFPTSGSYHIEVYKDRTSENDSIVACGDMKYVAG
jgi:hypothetical protein